MTIDGEFSYVVVNNSNKIEVVKANTFEAVHTIDGLSLPRYLTTLDGAGYVTEWVSFADPGRVTKIDLEDHTAGESIPLDMARKTFLLMMDCFMYPTALRIPSLLWTLKQRK